MMYAPPEKEYVDVREEHRFKVTLSVALRGSIYYCEPRRLGYLMFTQSQCSQVLEQIRKSLQGCLGPKYDYVLYTANRKKRIDEPEDLIQRAPSGLGEYPTYVSHVTAWIEELPGEPALQPMITFWKWLWITSLLLTLSLAAISGSMTDGSAWSMFAGMSVGFLLLTMAGITGHILTVATMPNPLNSIKTLAQVQREIGNN